MHFPLSPPSPWKGHLKLKYLSLLLPLSRIKHPVVKIKTRLHFISSIIRQLNLCVAVQWLYCYGPAMHAYGGRTPAPNKLIITRRIFQPVFKLFGLVLAGVDDNTDEDCEFSFRRKKWDKVKHMCFLTCVLFTDSRIFCLEDNAQSHGLTLQYRAILLIPNMSATVCSERT